jgi:hypothetical protein
MIIVIGLGILFLAIRGILRQKYEFRLGYGKVFVLQGSAAVVTASIHGIGAILIVIPYIVEITTQWPDYPAFLPLVFAGFIILADHLVLLIANSIGL